MSAISTYLQQILNAIWARDVRQAIHDAISQCYDDVNAPALQTEAMQAAVQAKIDAGEMAALTIADGSLTGAKLANGTIPTAKIADGAITAGKLASDAVPTDTTLTQSGMPADAKKTGDEISDLKSALDEITESGEVEVDRSTFVNMSDYFISGGNIHNIGQSSGTSIMYIPCSPNTKYTITKILSARFILAYTTETPQSDVLTYDYETHNGATSVEYETGNDAEFLCVYYKHSSDTLTETEIYNSITIKYGSGTELTAVDKVARRAVPALASLSSYGDISTADGFVTAFNAAMADWTIGGISIPFGTYNVNSPLNITRSNITIDGNGCTLNMRDDNGNPVNSHCFVINNKSRITICNFLVNMRQSKSSTSGTTFYFLDTNFIKVENIDIYQIGCRGALIFNSDSTSSTSGSQKIFFKNVKFRGINEQNTTTSEWPCGIIGVNLVDSRFENCVVSGMCRFTIEFKNYTKNCCMINNVVYGNSFGYENESGIALGCDRPANEGDKIADGIIFIGNIVRNCKYPLYIGRTSNLIVSNNILEGQIFMEKINSAVLSGNVMKSTNKYNIPLIKLDASNDILFTGNIYEPNSNNLFLIGTSQPQTNIFVNGLLNGKEINVVNPTSGTPKTT